MSEPRGVARQPSVALVVFVACAALWPSRAGVAQTTGAQNEAELIQRIEELRPQYEAAEAARDMRLRERLLELSRTREAERTSAPLDTVQVGPMSIVSRPEEAAVARDLFGSAWREHYPGVTESPALRSSTFVFQWRARLRSLAVEPGSATRIVEVDISRVWAPTRANAEVVVSDAIARALVDDFRPGSPVPEWMTYRANPDDESAYRALAAGGSGATRECLTGDVSACMAALGFGLRDETARLPAWFSDEDRQAMVRGAAEEGRVDLDGVPYRRCVEENDVRACDPILAELDWVTNPPVSDRLRAHLLWFAAREGGEGAWGRAIDAGGTSVPGVLAQIADRPIEQLVDDWRAYVVAQRPDVHAGLGGRGTRALLWSLIFAALAMRSTRWRLA